MRKERRKLLLAGPVAVALLGGLVWLGLRNHEPPEPVYQGKRLSEWLSPTNPNVSLKLKMLSVKPPVDELLLEAGPKEAVEQMGTNTIPTLLRLLRAHDSGLKLKFIKLAQKQHLVKINFSPATQWNEKAAAAFLVLGADARNAVPDLIRILKQDFSASSQLSTADALGSIGTASLAAVPELLRLAAKTNVNIASSASTSPVHLPGLFAFGPVSDHAIVAIRRMEVDPGLAVRALKQCLKDSDPALRKLAATELVRLLMNPNSAPYPWMPPAYNIATRTFDRDPSAPIPSLADVLKDPDADVRTNVAQALKAIDPEAAAKAGVK